MKKLMNWVMAATLISGLMVFSSCTDKDDDPPPTQPSQEESKTMSELKEEMSALYGENKKITDGNYDPSLAVKCINGTFVGRKTGKYADFLLVTKDVLTCPVTEIHEAKPAATYFEGRKVYSM